MLKRFSEIDTFRELSKWAGKKSGILTGLNTLGRALLIATLKEEIGKPIIFITKNEAEQSKIGKLLSELFAVTAHTYPILRSDTLHRAEFIDSFERRVELTGKLSEPGSVTFFSGEHLLDPLSEPLSHLELKVGGSYDLNELLKELVGLGYEREAKTFQKGEMATRGEVLDIFPIQAETPWRLVFNGDVISQIYNFDPVNGNRLEEVNSVTVPALKNKSFAPTLAKYLSEHKDEFLVILDHSEDIMQSLYEMFVASESEDLAALDQTLNSLPIIKIETIAENGHHVNMDFMPPPIFASQMDRMITEIDKRVKEGWQVILSTDKQKSLTQILSEAELATASNPALIPYIPHLASYVASLKLLILSDEDIFAMEEATTHKASAKQQRVFMADIQRGDYIVHTDHGIGRLIDIQRITLGEVEREYLILEYAKGDKLYVPIDQIDKISKYVSVDGREPVLTRLSSQSWKRAVAKIKKESHKFAKELLDLYAKRALKQGISFNSDEAWEKALADTFGYEETPDQETVIQEILADMTGEKPMDRLLVADVGFGKTEVAIRAAFKAITAGYQVAYLAPTTILVEQQYKTFTERLKSFGTRVAALSRFKSAAEQDKVVAELKLGEVDVVIGTHRLLSKDIKFKNLGLIIIDEEQRFGVGHKEKLKTLRNEVDVLSLTATPIPRTLNLALSGIRDISIIETPPSSRLSIMTHVTPFSSETVKNAIEKEIKRGGQIYFIHNRVQTIDTAQHKLEMLMPEVKFIHAHGQMGERLLAKIMQEFNQHKYDVLIASTIIENGIDNPNVNTLIVDDAGHFGLSQLHQLRGRIGRGKVQAYAYFLYNKGKMTPKALERLKTIQEHSELGSGYNIAMRDMQIRGAGGVLSRDQHGHITAIGLSLYTKLLNKAIDEMRSGHKIDVSDVTIDLPISAYVPIKYIDAESQRLKIYQSLGIIDDAGELDTEFKKIQENFGELPLEVKNLQRLLHLKLAALKTQQVMAITAKNTMPSSMPAKYLITIALTKTLAPTELKPLLALSPTLQVGEKEIKLYHTDFSGDWLDGLTRFIGLLKKV